MIRNASQFMMVALVFCLMGMSISSAMHGWESLVEMLQLSERALFVAALILGPTLGDVPEDGDDDGYYGEDWLLT